MLNAALLPNVFTSWPVSAYTSTLSAAMFNVNTSDVGLGYRAACIITFSSVLKTTAWFPYILNSPGCRLIGAAVLVTSMGLLSMRLYHVPVLGKSGVIVLAVTSKLESTT